MILAPMQGLTEVLFRRTYEECFPHAIQSAVSPFISLTHGPLRNPSKLTDVLPENNAGSIPVVPQLLGKEPAEFVEVANHLFELGYTEVNWNMGCPMRMVAAKHRGSGILPYPNEVRALLDSVVPQLKVRLSVKVRLGLNDKEEIFRLVPILNDYPIASVTVHPRLGRQQYNGVPDLDTFGQLLPLLKAPVVYNGDICTVHDAQRIRQRFPSVADLMVGRGVLYRPTLPLELQGEPLDEATRLDQTKHFVRTLFHHVRQAMPTTESVLRKTKEYWCLLWKALPISEERARTLLRATCLEDVDNLLYDLIQ